MMSGEIVTRWYDRTWTADEIHADIEATTLAATGDERYSRGVAQFVTDGVRAWAGRAQGL